MKKYAKIYNEESKSVLVGLGTNSKYYESIGMVEMEVEEAYDGNWYVAGYAPQKPQELTDQENLIAAKSERADYVSKIVVEVDGMQFDGDETSQDRMVRAAYALNDGETVQWVLADNTIAQVTKEQLRQALRLAGEAQTSIWANPYIKEEPIEE